MKIRLGTRSSDLARAQAAEAQVAICAAVPGAHVEIVAAAAPADGDTRSIEAIGVRGMFATHLERMLLDGLIDVAVHSCKDVAFDPPPDLMLFAALPREDPRDVLVGAASLDALPEQAKVSTGSQRRAALLAMHRPDLVAAPIRGNVATRIAASAARGDGACMLAAAGLHRLGLTESIDCYLPVDAFVPDAGQGTVVLQATGDTVAKLGLDGVGDRAALELALLERHIAAVLGGGCSEPVGVHAWRGTEDVTNVTWFVDGSISTLTHVDAFDADRVAADVVANTEAVR